MPDLDDVMLRELHRRRRAGDTPDVLAQAYGFASAREVFLLLRRTMPGRRRGPDERALARAARLRAVRVDDEAVVTALRALSQALAAEQGSAAPVHVSRRQWDARRDVEGLPSGARVAARYRSWHLACAAAGLPPSDRPAQPGTPRRWTDLELRVWVARFLLGATGPTTTGEYALWAGRHAGAPGLQTVVLRLGGWGAAKASALGQPPT